VLGGAQRDHDPVIHDAQALVHRHPERDWTTQSLAAAVRVSRATLHRHFDTSLGIAPLAYVIVGRMHVGEEAVNAREGAPPGRRRHQNPRARLRGG
jgi:transcriptional regulator GlxA family with amidase domain